MRIRAWRAERCPGCQRLVSPGEWADWRGTHRLYHPACAPVPLRGAGIPAPRAPGWDTAQLARALDALEAAVVGPLGALGETPAAQSCGDLLRRVEKLRRLAARPGTVEEGRTATRQAFRLLLTHLLK